MSNSQTRGTKQSKPLDQLTFSRNTVAVDASTASAMSAAENLLAISSSVKSLQRGEDNKKRLASQQLSHQPHNGVN